MKKFVKVSAGSRWSRVLLEYKMLTATPGSPLSSAPSPDSPNHKQSEVEEGDNLRDYWRTERYYSFLKGYTGWEDTHEEARKKQRTELTFSSASVPVLAEDTPTVRTEQSPKTKSKRADQSKEPRTKLAKRDRKQEQQAVRDADIWRQLSPDVTTTIQWTNAEEKELGDLVKLYKKVVPHPLEKLRKKGVTQDVTDWKTIGARLKKPPVECVRKWNKIEYTVHKSGPFSYAEDALIEQRVSENKGQGVWAALQKELGRSAGAIRQRWFTTLGGK